MLIFLAPNWARAEYDSTVLREFGDAFWGPQPADLIEGSDGMLYGASPLGGAFDQGFIFRVDKNGNRFNTLRTFVASYLPDSPFYWDSGGPYRLFEGRDGFLYGASKWGGYTAGTIFRMKKDGSEYSIIFASTNSFCLTGIRGEFLFGIRSRQNVAEPYEIFQLDTDGNRFRVLNTFGPTSYFETNPHGIVSGSDGMIYGITGYGGDSAAGSIFRGNQDGSECENIFSFDERFRGGLGPEMLLEGIDGRLYGTVHQPDNFSLIEVFSIGKDGGNFTVIKSGLIDPQIAMTPDGWIFGFTKDGLFKMRIDGTEDSFLAPNPDGVQWGLVGSDNAFYGITPSSYSFQLPSQLVRLKEFTAQDFKRIKTGDLIFRTANNRLAVWFMSGTNRVGSMIIKNIRPQSSKKRFIGMEQLDYEGNTAIFWQQSGSRNLTGAILSGTNISQSFVLDQHLRHPSKRALPGLTDYDTNGWQDFLFQDSAGNISASLMNTTQILGLMSLGINVPKSWRLLGAADLNGDSNPDLLLRKPKGGLLVQSFNGSYQGIWQIGLDKPKFNFVGFWDFDKAGENESMLVQMKDRRIGFYRLHPWAEGPFYLTDERLPRGWRWLGVVR